ncbi:hypothetical protein AVEN_169305-1 [Araneus ventricosus]|uniref:Uncharacterized protein n=1 Tax=Araneus ventricosus TaxID=182803 RepID=A0A4Y2JTN2_ARAVE|nr:hypothetical protein AVEN_169305-1 [Araneus ventricosus]
MARFILEIFPIDPHFEGLIAPSSQNLKHVGHLNNSLVFVHLLLNKTISSQVHKLLVFYATSCHMTLSYHFTKRSAENTQLWWKSVLSNKPSRINIARLISLITENVNLIKQPPDATSLSNSDPDFSPSPRPQTYGQRPSRGSIPRTLFSPPTSI